MRMGRIQCPPARGDDELNSRGLQIGAAALATLAISFTCALIFEISPISSDQPPRTEQTVMTDEPMQINDDADPEDPVIEDGTHPLTADDFARDASEGVYQERQTESGPGSILIMPDPGPFIMYHVGEPEN